MFYEGEDMGYVGNFGYVLPAPTIGQPLNGAHAHITIVLNGKVVDPLLFLDPRNPFRGEDTGFEKDKPAITRAIQLIKEYMAKLVGF